MNCSYRIIGAVNIGERVRKTADATTVKFDNKPFSGAKIESYTKDGFSISHESLPKIIWLDFEQLPLTTLTIINGIIQDEITFVEALFGKSKTSMVLIKTQTFDYLELLDDKKTKETSKLYSIKDIKPGDNVISALCREGTVMTYLGSFVATTCDYVSQNYKSYDKYEEYYCVTGQPIRAFFAYKEKDKYSIKEYALTNKAITELYKANEKDTKHTAVNDQFTDVDKNLNVIRHAYNSDYWKIAFDVPSHVQVANISSWRVKTCFISKEKLSYEEIIKFLKPYNSHNLCKTREDCLNKTQRY